MIYPGRASRTNMIKDFLEGAGGAHAVLCGRVIGLLDGEGVIFSHVGEVEQRERGFVLQDASGKTIVLSQDLPPVGAIIEVDVERGVAESLKQVGQATVLADCEDFYISLNNSPNYKKMVIDEKLRHNLIKRAEIVAGIREFFVKQQFLEVETPCLVRLPGMEPYLDVFKTRFEADFSADQKLNEDMYLITSPEYAMKKLLVGGLEKIFQITKSFRNKETFSKRHNPEFSILEWYRAFASYLEIMDDTEKLVQFLWQKFSDRDALGAPPHLEWNGKKIEMMVPWKRIRILEAFQEYAGIGEAVFFDLEALRAEVKKRGYGEVEKAGFDDLFYLIFLNDIEPKLGMEVPTIVYDYPVSMAALSKRCAGDVRFAERFEVYIGGLELCNGFTELNDPSEQQSRLNQEKEERRLSGKELYGVDQTFIDALKFGMPPSGGNALGVDRLIMLIFGESEICNVINFPHRDL